MITGNSFIKVANNFKNKNLLTYKHLESVISMKIYFLSKYILVPQFANFKKKKINFDNIPGPKHKVNIFCQGLLHSNKTFLVTIYTGESLKSMGANFSALFFR